MAKSWRGFLGLKEAVKSTEAPPESEQRTIIVNGSAVGSSGTLKFGGIVTEDYFRTLVGAKKADEYDKMRRGDARVKMCLKAAKDPMKSANWAWIAAGDSDEEKRHAELLNHIFDNDIGPVNGKAKTKIELINEATSVVDFGIAAFERAHKTVLGHPDFGSYIGLKTLGWRSPKTLQFFHTDSDGNLVDVEQWVQGDVARKVKIPAQWLTLIVLDKEGDNYEGVSALRPCYGAWSRKQMYLKLMAIGNERSALPTPKVKVPAGKEMSDEYGNMKAAVESLTSHQQNFIMVPEGWELEYLESNFDPEKLKSSIQFENEEMTFAFLANFLMLGSGGNAGAYALSADLSKFFTRSILHIADLIAQGFQEVGRELIDLNYGPQKTYPKMVPQGIVDEIAKEFADMLKILADSKLLTPDNNLENELRKRLKLMPMRPEDEDKRDNPPTPPPVNPDAPSPPAVPAKKAAQLTEANLEFWRLKDPGAFAPHTPPSWVRRLLLAETRAQKFIGESQDQMRAVLRDHLSRAGADIVSQIMKNYRNSTPANQDSAINGVEAGGTQAFRDDLKKALARVSLAAIEGARKEVPKAAKVKLKDADLDNIQLAEFERLPTKIQKRVLMQSRLMVTTTGADLEKAVFLQFGDSVISTDSAAIIEKDLADAVETVVNGSSVSAAGGNAASRLVNESRNAFFFDEEVISQIESFTFINGDPVSPICQDLAGQTMSSDDVESQRLFPPLHYNCKSYLSANLVGDKNPPVTGFKTDLTPQF